MAPETVDREKLKDALDDDAMAAYDEREEQIGEELMRYLERSILLQVIDTRWREHLYDMDYLREGIHLRGFAQIDPLVAYKNEGFAMFEELMHSIWEEFSKLIFHVEVEIDPARAQAAFAPNGEPEPAALDYSGGTLEAQPSALRQVAAAGSVGAMEMAAAGGGAAATAPPEVVETVVKDEREKTSAATTRAGAGQGKKFKKCHGAYDPVREFIRAFNERDLDAFVEVLDPEVELHSMRGLRKGRGGGAAVGDPGARGRAADDRAGGAVRGRDRVGGAAVALIRRVWHWDEDGSPAGEDEMAWLFELRDHRIRSWRPFEDRAEALRAGASTRRPVSCADGRDRLNRIGAGAARRDPRAVEAARGLPLTRLRCRARSSGSRPRCSAPASGTTRRPPPAPPPPTPAPSAS